MTARLDRTASGARHLRWAREVYATVNAHIRHNTGLSDEQRELLNAELTTGTALISNLAVAVTGYRGWLDTGWVENRANLRVANFMADEEQKEVEATLRPHRETLAEVLPGGLKTVFSGLPLSAVLRAGQARTARLCRDAALALTTVSGVRGLPDLTGLAGRLDGAAERLELLLEERVKVIEPQRRPLKLSVERAVLELREGLDKMDGRLRQKFGPSFIESLYPELATGSRAVADDADDPDPDDDDTE